MSAAVPSEPVAIRRLRADEVLAGGGAADRPFQRVRRGRDGRADRLAVEQERTEEIGAGPVAVALRVTVPESVDSGLGLVRVTVGGVELGCVCSSTFTVSPSIWILVSVRLLEGFDSSK